MELTPFIAKVLTPERTAIAIYVQSFSFRWKNEFCIIINRMQSRFILTTNRCTPTWLHSIQLILYADWYTENENEIETVIQMLSELNVLCAGIVFGFFNFEKRWCDYFELTFEFGFCMYTILHGICSSVNLFTEWIFEGNASKNSLHFFATNWLHNSIQFNSCHHDSRCFSLNYVCISRDKSFRCIKKTRQQTKRARTK